MRVTAISGYGVKGPACFLVETEGRRFLLDLGEGPQPGRFPDLAGIGAVDAILISHGHVDHIGGLHLAPRVSTPPIYATAMVRALKGHAVLAAAHDLPLGGRIEIAGIPVETGRAGHAPGGVWMRIGGEDGVLYSGDLCRESLLYPCDTPSKARLLIADASYGSFDTPLEAGMQAVMDAAARGPLLLPVPPTGRGLEMAVLMHERGMPVGVCPQHRQAADAVLRQEGDVLVPGGIARLSAAMDAASTLDAESAPRGVMIAGNGAATGGISQALMTRFAAMPEVDILFTGHIEAGIPARALIDTGRARFIRWNVHPRARDLRWLVDCVQPQAMLPAFLAGDALAKLGEALHGTVLSGPVLSDEAEVMDERQAL